MTLTQIKPAGLSKPVDLADNEKIRLGTGNDLEIYHDGNNSIISDSGTGDLVLKTNGAKIAFTTGGGTEIAEFVNNGACNLRHQSTSRLTTTSTGVNILGSDTTGSNLNGDLVINNAAGTRYAVFDASHTKLNFSNDADATFGDSNDLKIYHTSTGNSSYIINSTGNLNIGSNNEIRLKGGDDVAEHMGRFIDNGAVELYYDASKKFETQSTGAKVTGQLNFDDGSSTANTNGIGFGSSQDCRVFHDGSSFQIRNVTGPVTCITPSFFRLAADSSNDTMFKAIQDGAVELYYDNSMKMATQSAGVTMEQSLYMANSNASIFWGTSGGYGAQHGIGTAQLANYHVSGTGVGDMVIAAKNQKNILFATAPNNSGGIDASGGQWRMRINTDTTIDISSRIHAQSGINFGTDSAAANALDDYEEGTWTPSFGIGTPTDSSGSYTKIGRMVYAAFKIASGSTGSSAHQQITGLPFAAENANPNENGVAAGYQTYDVENGPIYHISKGGTIIYLYKNNGVTLAASNLSGLELRGTAIYRT